VTEVLNDPQRAEARRQAGVRALEGSGMSSPEDKLPAVLEQAS